MIVEGTIVHMSDRGMKEGMVEGGRRGRGRKGGEKLGEEEEGAGLA